MGEGAIMVRIIASIKSTLLVVISCACACTIALALAACGQQPSASGETSSDAAAKNEQTARDFVEQWYGDWSFADGEMKLASSNAAARCIGFVDADSQLANKMQELMNFRDAARCLTAVEVTGAEGGGVQADVEYVSVQNTGIDEATFKELKEHVSTDSLVFTFDKDGRVESITGLH